MFRCPILALYAVVKKINLVCVVIAGVILLFVNLSIFVEVFLRYLFARPTTWITETSTYLFLYIIFLSAPYVLQNGQHIRVTFLRFNLRPALTRVLDLICSSFAIVFCAVLLWQVSIMTWTAHKEAWVSPTILSAPLAYVYLAMVIGSALLLITFLLKTFLEFQNIDPEAKGGKGP